MSTMSIAFFGSSLVSAYWNGAATYYRGVVRALHARGHRITFYEPNALDRQKHRDIPDPPWARVVVYSGTDASEATRMVERASRDHDIVVKASGVGVFDALLEEAVLAQRRSRSRIVFWDVDAPATLERLRRDPSDPLRHLVPKYDVVLTYGGGAPVVAGYERLGARRCVPIYNALDPDIHHPAAADARFRATLALLANRFPDRERRVDEFFLGPAAELPDSSFLLGGSGWNDKPCSPNVRRIGHVFTAVHNAFNSTPLAVLNVERDSMASCGYSPATRIFEAAGAAACIITDAWPGIESFLEPEQECLVAEDGEAVVRHLRGLTPARARAIGEAAARRIRKHHTYSLRAREVEAILSEKQAPTIEATS